MDLDVVILGTSGSVPTPRRALASLLIRRGGERILVDCGEGTQRQMMRSCGLSDIDTILVTHEHGDHILGLPGMLKTFQLRERSEPLTIVGTQRFVSIFQSLHRVIGRTSFPLEILVAEDGWSRAGAGYVLEAFRTDHTVPSLGWRLVEHDRPGRFDLNRARELGVPEGRAYGVLQRGDSVTLESGDIVRPEDVLGAARSGRTVVVTGDTRASARVREAALSADVLVHESTFSTEEQQRARETGHSTAQEAALTAAAADVRMLVLTHISNRYFGKELQEEARAIFENTVLPRDFDLINVPYAESGEPTLIQNGSRDTHPQVTL